MSILHDPEAAKVIGDRVAVTAGAGASAVSLTDLSTLAGQMTPILSAIVLLLTIVWWMWRAYDRVKYGPKRGRDDE